MTIDAEAMNYHVFTKKFKNEIAKNLMAQHLTFDKKNVWALCTSLGESI